MKASHLAAIAVFLLVGCRGGDADDFGSAITARDSAGVAILEIDWATTPLGGVLDPVPDWIVGEGAEGESLLLHQVRHAVILGDGSLIVADGGGRIVRVDLDRGESSRWGRQGGGPGEFANIGAVFVGAQGGLGVLDTGRRRYVELGGDGEVLAEVDLDPLIQGPLLDAAVGSDGTIYLGVAAAFPEGSGVLRPTGDVIRVARWGRGGVDTLGTFQGFESFRSPEFMGLLFFGATGVMEGADQGVWTGDTGEPEVEHWTGGDAPERIVRWNPAFSRTSEEEKARLLGVFLDRLPPDQRPFFEEQMEAIPVREVLPAFESIIAGEDGTVWIGEYTGFVPELLELPLPEQEWLVVDPERRSAHRIVTPEGVRVIRVGAGFILAVYRDGLGVETVRQYSIEPAEGTDSG